MSAPATKTMQTVSATIRLEYIKTIGIVNNGLNGRGFANPCDVAVTRDGRIFVLNRCDPPRATAIRVGICNLEEEYLGEFGNGYGSGDGQFVLPVAMAFDSRERLFVTDEYNHRVTMFDSSGTFLDKWGVHGSGEGEIDGPAGVAVDSDGNLYVADQNNHRIQKFTSDGRHILGWGEFGQGDGQFNRPWGLSIGPQGDVYVADWRNDRVQKFTWDGQFLASFGESGQGDGQFRRPSAVAVDPEGFVYVSDWGNERVQVLRPDGGFEMKLMGQATLSRWAEEFFASNPDEKSERDRSNLIPRLPDHLNAPYHISSQTEPYFWGPVSVKLDSEGRLYVTESCRHRLQIYQKK